MKTHQFPFKLSSQFCGIAIFALLTLLLAASSGAQTQTNHAPPEPLQRPVTASDSTMVRGARVYSIKVPGEKAAEFFQFLRTNGFANDNILFAARAGRTHVPPFEVNHVRLKDVAKAIELVTEG